MTILQLEPLAGSDIDDVGVSDLTVPLCASAEVTAPRALFEEVAGCPTIASDLTRARWHESGEGSSSRRRPKYEGHPYPTVTLAEIRGRYNRMVPVEVTAPPLWSWATLVSLLTVLALFWILGLHCAGWVDGAYLDTVQAGTSNWKAFLFGPSGTPGAGTGAPAALWPAEVMVWCFGTHPSVVGIIPALLILASVAMLFPVVARPFGAVAGLIACAAFAVTPAVTATVQHDSPEGLLVLVAIGAAWCVTRAVGDGRTRWLVGCGVLIGVGLLTAHLQMALIAPGLALSYLIAGPVTLPRRAAHLLTLTAAALAVVGGWLMARAVGTSDPDIYRSTLAEAQRMVRFSGTAGITPGYGSALAQISWLLPTAGLALGAGILLCGSISRTDPRRAGYLLFGGWVLSCSAVLWALRPGPDAVAPVLLAPAIAALVGMGVAHLWPGRHSRLGGLALGAVVASSALWPYLVQQHGPEMAWLRGAVLIGGTAAVALLVLARTPLDYSTGNRLTVWAAAICAVVALGGPVHYTIGHHSPGDPKALGTQSVTPPGNPLASPR